jgi:hypothetical protein
MAAKIRINPERSEVEFITPEGDLYGDDELDSIAVLGDSGYIGVAGSVKDLKPNTIYKLTPVKTELEENALIEELDEDEIDGDEDDDEDEDEEELPIASVGHRAKS